ncbi:MAG TPA: hypothetical protein VME46_08490 [Acidimicrobiales bacterium]|nr:hypothetical protein [Acidimicrobiales bacterium]
MGSPFLVNGFSGLDPLGHAGRGHFQGTTQSLADVVAPVTGQLGDGQGPALVVRVEASPSLAAKRALVTGP